jgi:hypothetical protein
LSLKDTKGDNWHKKSLIENCCHQIGEFKAVALKKAQIGNSYHENGTTGKQLP